MITALSTGKRYFFKFNYQLNQNNRIQAQIHNDYYEIPQRATANDAPSSVLVETGKRLRRVTTVVSRPVNGLCPSCGEAHAEPGATGESAHAAWVAGAYALARFAWHRGTRKYSAVGG